MAIRIESRVRECPSCGHRFQSNNIKCFCPQCDSTFFAGQDRYTDLSKPLVCPVPPSPIEELSAPDRQLAHWLLALAARDKGPLDWYPIIEFGWWRITNTLAKQGFLKEVRDTGFFITDLGNEKLKPLNATHGEPSYPRRKDPQYQA